MKEVVGNVDEIKDLEQLEEMISEPSFAVVDTLARLDGDIIILELAVRWGRVLHGWRSEHPTTSA